MLWTKRRQYLTSGKIESNISYAYEWIKYHKITAAYNILVVYNQYISYLVITIKTNILIEYYWIIYHIITN